MIELPESCNLTNQLNRSIRNKTIKTVEANRSPHKFAFYFKDDPDSYSGLLCGKVIDSVSAFGGKVEIFAKNTRILLSEDINIRYFSEAENVPPKHHLHIQFDDGSSLVCSVKMYGVIYAFNEGENDNPYYIVAKEKPSPLLEEFNSEYFENIIAEAKQTLSAKALLATEQRIPGLGNGCLQDILFNAKIHPKTKLAALRGSNFELLYKSVKNTLLEMTEKCGRDTEKDLFGNSGGYKTILSKSTYKKPCPVCGGEIVKQAYLGGNVYFCPNCQPLNA